MQTYQHMLIHIRDAHGRHPVSKHSTLAFPTHFLTSAMSSRSSKMISTTSGFGKSSIPTKNAKTIQISVPTTWEHTQRKVLSPKGFRTTEHIRNNRKTSHNTRTEHHQNHHLTSNKTQTKPYKEPPQTTPRKPTRPQVLAQNGSRLRSLRRNNQQQKTHKCFRCNEPHSKRTQQ